MLIRSVYKKLAAGANTLSWKVGNLADLWLIGVNLEETDSSSNPTLNNSGSIWIEDPSEGNSLSLAHGLLLNGQIGGYGAVPLNVGQNIVGKLWHSDVNDIGKLNVYLIEPKSVKSSGLTPTWSQRQAQGVFLQGQPKVKEVTGTASSTTTDLQPAAGYLWRILECWGTHDDAGNARTCNFGYFDGTTLINKDGVARTPPQIHYLSTADGTFDVASAVDCIIISNTNYIRWTVTAIGAGKHGIIRAFVLEYVE
jgi:hypothetical protein